MGGISGGVTTNLGVGGGGLKPHRLLSRSCSGTIRTEEMDGLKHHHRLLSRSYSSSTKIGKADIFKDSVPEGRRLSLTSGLIGILAPSLATPPAVSKQPLYKRRIKKCDACDTLLWWFDLVNE